MTQSVIVANSTARAGRSERPILSREADSTYWMSRYVERAENVARLLLATTESMIDVRDVDPAMLEKKWQSVLRVMNVELPEEARTGPGDVGAQVASFMAFGESNVNSLQVCLTRARENARGIREGISSDMWEYLNRVYWAMRSEESRALFNETPPEFFKECIAGAMTFQGLTDQTLPHDQRWHFAQLGKYFERIAFTCRVLAEETVAFRSGVDSPIRNLQWMNVLRSCNSDEAYRRAHPGEIQPLMIAVFLLLDRTFPRSVRYCVASAKKSIAAISAEVRPRTVDPAERILGRLQAQLEYADVAEFETVDLATYLEQIVQQTSLAAMAVQEAYFLH